MGMLKNIPVRLRITTGLVGLMVGSLLMASALGFFPNEQREILKGRAKLCETLAITGTGMASSGQMATLQRSLEAVVKRDDDVLSIGLRTMENQLLVVAGPHNEHWKAEYESGVQQNKVPVFRGGKKWADLEVCFAGTGGILGLNYWAPAWLLIVMVPALFFQYSIFLRKTLKHLDPSAGVPQHVQDALNTLSVGLVLLDDGNRILFANSKFGEAVERSSEDVEGEDLSMMAWDLPSELEEIDDPESELPWKKVDHAKGVINDQLLHMTIDGRRRAFSINCTKVGNGVMATFDDITLLEEARAAALQASESKSSFLANMSHEIRTPLNAVLGFTDVLRRGLVTDTEESLDHLNMIHRSGKHLLRLINDILDLSKIEAGKMDVESIDTDLGELIVDTADVLGVRAREKDLDLNVEFHSSIPAIIQSDPTRLRQIITNLVGNAIKFTETGSVTIATELAAENGPRLKVNIIDSGVGMTPEQQAKIFDSFSQADETTTRKFGGTGLGLSISRQLTEALGGQLTVSSEAGVGSTFTIELPLNQEDLQELIQPEAILANRENQPTGDCGETIRLPNKQILVVDDGEANRRLIELVITRAGAQVATAENGLEAIEKVSENEFDLIFMDMQMPVIDGYTATKRLRDAGLQTPIIALTGNAMKGDRERCLEAGCDDFLTKPVEIDRLLERTAHYIGHGDSVKDARPGNQLADSDTGIAKVPVQFTDAEKQNQAATSIQSSLPVDDPAFREIVVDFIGRLESRLDGIETALTAADFEHVRSEAHWLKGAGGTVGFTEFTDPAMLLENAARQQDSDQTTRLLATINDIYARIEVPGFKEVSTNLRPTVGSESPSPQPLPGEQTRPDNQSADGPPIACALPFADQEMMAIVVDYIARLDSKLELMEKQCEQGQFEELAAQAHWLKGSGGTVGFDALSKPAALLEQAAKNRSQTDARRSLESVLAIRKRLVVPAEAGSQSD